MLAKYFYLKFKDIKYHGYEIYITQLHTLICLLLHEFHVLDSVTSV